MKPKFGIFPLRNTRYNCEKGNRVQSLELIHKNGATIQPNECGTILDVFYNEKGWEPNIYFIQVCWDNNYLTLLDDRTHKWKKI